MTTLANLFYDAAMFISLEPEDAASVLLLSARKVVGRVENDNGDWPVFEQPPAPPSDSNPNWPSQSEEAVRHAFAEAVEELKRRGFIMPGLVSTRAGPAKLIFTRRGLLLQFQADINAYRFASVLPASLVHSAVAKRVIPLFLRGDRDSAVYYAFREVEIAVRAAAGYDDAKHGMPMMRDAFHPKNGPLTDRTLPPGEQEAEAALFAGAIGHGRNPVSHRDVDMTPTEAARLILLASHLLSIVEKRIADRAKKGECG